MAAIVCSAASCKAQAVQASSAKPKVAAPVVLPRVKGAVVAAGAAVLLSATPAMAFDLALGEEVFNNNCGSLSCGSVPMDSSSAGAMDSAVLNAISSSSSSSSSSAGPAHDGPAAAISPAPAAPEAHSRSSASGRDSSSTPGSSGNSRASPWLPGTARSKPLLHRPLLRLKQPASLMLLQAACHTGGMNSVQVEKTLQKAALEQYLAGGFNVDAIITQVENGKGAMPAWSGRLSEDEIESVANYVFKQAEGDLW